MILEMYMWKPSNLFSLDLKFMNDCDEVNLIIQWENGKEKENGKYFSFARKIWFQKKLI